MSGPLILGIESSCDETGVGIVRGHELLANEVASSVEEHVRFGGVVPEVASRAHLEAMVPTLQRACATADIDLTEIDGIAVTAGPGLMGALVVGLAAAKALAYALDKPLYAVNHLAGHVAVDLLEHGPLPAAVRRAAGLRRPHLAAAGRPTIADRRSPSSASTIDDAAGEAYDKVARVLGLPYPGGPHIDRARRPATRGAIAFPRGLTARQGPGPAPLRLLLLRAEDRGGPLGRDRASGTGGRAARRRRRQLPGGGLRRAERQGHGRLRGDRGHGPADRRRGGGQPPAARAAGRAGRASTGSRCVRRVPALCTDNGAMIAVLGAELVTAGGRPSRAGHRRRLLAAGQPHPALTRPMTAAAALRPDRGRAGRGDGRARSRTRWRAATRLRAGRSAPDLAAAAAAPRPRCAAAARRKFGARRRRDVLHPGRAGAGHPARGRRPPRRPASSPPAHAGWSISGCGIGSDALAFAPRRARGGRRGARPETAAVAAANLAGRAEVDRGDAEEVADDLLDAGRPRSFCDPARRTDRGRLWRVEDFTPAWSLVELAARRRPDGRRSSSGRRCRTRSSRTPPRPSGSPTAATRSRSPSGPAPAPSPAARRPLVLPGRRTADRPIRPPSRCRSAPLGALPVRAGRRGDPGRRRRPARRRTERAACSTRSSPT